MSGNSSTKNGLGLSKWGITRGASTLSRYFWHVRLPSRTYKSNLQSKEKQPQTVTPPLHALADRPMFMDDNARPYRARIVQQFLQQAAVQTIP
jgi:hypothetical protein